MIAVSDFSTVIRPMQQCLPLFFPTAHLPSGAILFDLHDMPLHGLPSFDLSLIIRAPSTHIISAVPLKPAAGVFMIYPALFKPYRQRLRRIDAEVIHLRIVPFVAKLCFREPVRRKLLPAVGHIFAAEYAQFQHLFRRQLRFEIGMKIPAHGFGQVIEILFLHQIVDDDFAFFHGISRKLKFRAIGNSIYGWSE